MPNHTPRSPRYWDTVRQHQQAISAGRGDFQPLSDVELARAHRALVKDLARAGGFGAVASRGLRDHCINQLAAISDEFVRRATRSPGSQPA